MRTLRYLLPSALLIVVLSMFASCSKEQTVPDSAPRTEQIRTQSELETSLVALNASYLDSTRRQTRFSFWKGAMVALADIRGAYRIGKIGMKVGALLGPNGATAGAIIGGAIGAAGYSYGMYKHVTSATIEHNLLDLMTKAYCYSYKDKALLLSVSDKSINSYFPTGYGTVYETGIYHNCILEAISSRLIDVRKEKIQLPPDQFAVLKNEEFRNAFKKGIEYIKRNGEPDPNELDGEGGEFLMKMFLELYRSYPRNLSDVNRIVGDYIKILEKTTFISDQEKELVYRSLSVAPYTFKYWKENF